MAAMHHDTMPIRTSHIVAALIVGMLIGACVVGAIWHDTRHVAHTVVVHRDNIKRGDWESIVHACTPRYVGGGVTQCDNPTTFDSAIVACFDNKAYARGMMAQCVNDFLTMKGWR